MPRRKQMILLQSLKSDSSGALCGELASGGLGSSLPRLVNEGKCFFELPSAPFCWPLCVCPVAAPQPMS